MIRLSDAFTNALSNQTFKIFLEILSNYQSITMKNTKKVKMD